MKRSWHILGLCCLAAVLGCERAALDFPEVRVVGRVTWHGAPVSRGTIVFAADPDRCDHQDLAIGVLHFDGSYELTTAEGKPPRPGWYRVSLASEDDRQRLPAKLADPTLSGLNAAVVGPSPQRVDWELP